MRQSTSTRAVTVAASLASYLVVAGCSGAGTATGPTATTGGSTAPAPGARTIAKTAFVSKTNKICTAANRLIQAAGEKTLPSPTAGKATPAQLRRYGKPVAKILLNEFELIRRLGTPPGDKVRVTKMLNTLGAEAEKAQAEPAELSSSHVFRGFANLAHAFGLASCGLSLNLPIHPDE